MPPHTPIPTSYPLKQWAAVRAHARVTNTPPHTSSPCSRTDTSHGQAPCLATLPPMMRPRGAVLLGGGSSRLPQRSEGIKL